MRDIIEMAREAGIEFTCDPTETPSRTFAECWMEELERFAELVRADEREQCIHAAEVAASLLNDPIAAIRARNSK